MNSHNPPNGWPPGGPPAPPPPGAEQQSLQQRPSGAFGPALPLQQAPQHQINGPPMMPQPTSFFASQANGHSLPAAPHLPLQASPMSANRGPPPPATQQQSPSSLPHPPPHPHYGLPALGPSMSHQSPPSGLQAERERDLMEREQERIQHERLRREQIEQSQRRQYEHPQDQYDQRREEHQQQRELLLYRDLQQREQLHSPRENHAVGVPLQQPVANRVTGSLHGPNGILNEQHSTSPSHAQPAQPSGAPTGPGNVFGGSIQAANDGQRSFPAQIHHGLQQQQQQQPPPPPPPQQPQLIHLTNAAPQHANGVVPLNQQQQPILNDALSYLDQVKVRFQDQPDVYNRFLDIMKDFKSQAIDTPGVIDRVSTLFAGHPELIQGFNTFLPPGYRIECSPHDDPNSIRVTTPMGTTVQQLPVAPHRLMNGVTSMDGHRPPTYQDAQQNGEWAAQAPEVEAQDPVAAAAAAAAGAQRNAESADLNRNAPGVGVTTPSFEEQLTLDAQGFPADIARNQQLLGSLEKRGPVEFNHAIGYVNKIKNRFSNQPEIYKQFLEILQTYQRESKPIQDVYAQVTQLFGAAPDLLEDFKQFLPESAAQAKAQAQAAAARQYEDSVPTSSMRDAGHSGGAARNQAQTPRPGDGKMPPMGSFAPPSVGKDSKKRRGGPASYVPGSAHAADTNLAGSSRNRHNVSGANKRARLDQARPAAPEAPPVSPSLVPALPTPLPPSKDDSSASEGLAFFDRVRKYLANRQTFNEFLKVCNLFSQNIIDRDGLVMKIHGFIGGNPELFNFFRRWVRYDGRDRYIQNDARMPSGKVVLSNCRGYGPSYRLLPRRETLRECSGRDEMCKSVLNDEWVSHPTWASEESGFIAHKKNLFEEALHRIEEERHDYDINIEACTRTIQLLEPIATSLRAMSEEDRYSYKLPPGIGGQSETIYQRVIKKIYDRDRGTKVINDMFRRPSAVIPIVLGRLKQKCEEWKASQRVWDNTWRTQTNSIFWKSLDHTGINIRASEKRAFQPKALHSEIQARYEEQRKARLVPYNNVPRYQFEFVFTDVEVIFDASHMILTCLHNSFSGNEVDKSRLDSFIKTFIPTFFDIDRDTFEEKMNDIEDASPPNEDHDEDNTDAESTTLRGRRAANGKKEDLRRGVLDRSKQQKDGAEDSGVTTPDLQSNDEDTPASTGTPTEQPRADPAEHRWLSYPSNGSETADLNKPFQREDFHLYATSNIYCFFRMFQELYERLLKLKSSEPRVRHAVAQAAKDKPADDLDFTDKRVEQFFDEVGPNANYYRQILGQCENVLKSILDQQHVEETLRRFYMRDGPLLYSFDRMLSSILRFGLQILVSDNKDKSLDIINLFYKDRKEDETTHQNELTYRKQVEKLGKDGDIFRIRYNRPAQTAFLQVFKKDDKTYEADELAASARWSYYVSTYSMLDRTEGIPLALMRLPFLRRNMPFPIPAPHYTSSSSNKDKQDPSINAAAAAATEGIAASSIRDAENAPLGAIPLHHHDGLVIRIAPNNYHILYDEGTSDWWVQSRAFQLQGLSGYKDAKEQRHKAIEELVSMKGESEEVVQRTKERFRRWIEEGPETLSGDGGAAAPAVEGGDNAATAPTDTAAPAPAASSGTGDVPMGGQ